jgi:hypothetical protein
MTRRFRWRTLFSIERDEEEEEEEEEEEDGPI